MTTLDLRPIIQERIESLGISRTHAAKLAGIPEPTARDYLAGGSMAFERVVSLAAAVGIDVSATVRAGFTPPPAPRPGRKPVVPE